MSLSITRRNLLRALGLTAAASMPVFRSGIGWSSQAPSDHRKLVAFKYNNGTQLWNWFPEGDEPEAALDLLPPLLQPFESVKSKTLVLDNLAYVVSEPGGSHNRGMHCFLSGWESGGAADVAEFQDAGDLTVDQYIANQLGDATTFPSLQLAVQGAGRSISFSGPATMLASESDPVRVYENLFADFVAPDDPQARAELERLRTERRSVLDHAAKELGALQAHLSSEDRLRLDAHLDAIRTLEQGLDKTAASTCVPPEAAPPEASEDVILTRQQIDLLVVALTCDLTRIATFNWGWGAHFEPTWVNVPEGKGLHYLSHEPRDNEASMALYFDALVFFSQEIAYFCERLDAIPGSEGSTMLDDSLVVVGTDNGDGKAHTVHRIPLLLAGSAGGYFRTGRVVRYADKTPHNGLLISICDAMGTPVETFGNPEHCSGPLPRLV